ncbi:gas2 domain containing protein [Stylonychia lemnae]|uniref:Gas2 domain containing protein n=1 Tax=Stylonychia lemnae TaxID=5949 RepID=A0A077ZYS4_STYLE|nr:gas2 domain containing protein [Stylonychia lemnae]|eukprot:CDW74767.1 gas2 domain containing protein [Stylonychia lemnae]
MGNCCMRVGITTRTDERRMHKKSITKKSNKPSQIRDQMNHFEENQSEIDRQLLISSSQTQENFISHSSVSESSYYKRNSESKSKNKHTSRISEKYNLIRSLHQQEDQRLTDHFHKSLISSQRQTIANNKMDKSDSKIQNDRRINNIEDSIISNSSNQNNLNDKNCDPYFVFENSQNLNDNQQGIQQSASTKTKTKTQKSSSSNLIAMIEQKLIRKTRITIAMQNKRKRHNTLKQNKPSFNDINFDKMEDLHHHERETMLKGLKYSLMKSIIDNSQDHGKRQRSQSQEKLKTSQTNIIKKHQENEEITYLITEDIEDDQDSFIEDVFDLEKNRDNLEDIRNEPLKNINNFVKSLKKTNTNIGLKNRDNINLIGHNQKAKGQSPSTKISRQNTMNPNQKEQVQYNKVDMFENHITYKAQIEGDRIDEMLENFVKHYKVRVPITRIDQSKYLFGMRLFHAQIINGILMVRVGGGFMTMEQFVDKHSTKEIFQLRVRMAKDKKKINKIITEIADKYKIKKFT